MDFFLISFICTGILVPLLIGYVCPDFWDELFVEPPKPPYLMRSPEVENDFLVKGIVDMLGGKDGPRLPQLVLRSMVKGFKRKGFEVVCTEDGRECVYRETTGREQVLMARREKS